MIKDGIRLAFDAAQTERLIKGVEGVRAVEKHKTVD